MYNTLEFSVAHAVPHSMVLSEVHDAGMVHIEEQADVFAIRGFEMIMDPGDDDRVFWSA